MSSLAQSCAASIGSRMIPGISAHYNKRLVMKNNTSLSEQRTYQIALEIITFEAKRRTTTLNDGDVRKEWDRFGDKIKNKQGFTSLHFKDFMIHQIMPHVLSAHFGEDLSIQGHTSYLSEKGNGEIALSIIRYKGVNLAKSDFENRLVRISKESKISVIELKQFYFEQVIPQVLGEVMQWDGCSITGTSV